MSSKLGLLIGNSHYEDSTLDRLVAPEGDVTALAGALRDPELGGFDEVDVLTDATAADIREAIARFFSERRRDDLLWLYFSGHGVLDPNGRLFLAGRDTQRDVLRATGVSAAFITEEMDNCRSNRQVLVLDCCHSGAFSQGSKGAVGASVQTAATFEGTGYGRVVLTAADATQYAWEDDDVTGEARRSEFTRHMVEGMLNGDADLNGDGFITVDELYDYVYEQVVTGVSEARPQTPGKWTYRQQGDLVIARSPAPAHPADRIPEWVEEALTSPTESVRLAGVAELNRLMTEQGSLAATAQVRLEEVSSADESRVVRGAASSALAAPAAETAPWTRAEQIEHGDKPMEPHEAESGPSDRIDTEPTTGVPAGEPAPAERRTPPPRDRRTTAPPAEEPTAAAPPRHVAEPPSQTRPATAPRTQGVRAAVIGAVVVLGLIGVVIVALQAMRGDDPGVEPRNGEVTDDGPPAVVDTADLVAVRAETPPTIDGDLAEWAAVPNVYALRHVNFTSAAWDGSEDLGADVAVAWDDQFLYLAAGAEDDRHVQPFTNDQIWRGDGFDVQVDRTGQGGDGVGAGHVEVILSPGDLAGSTPATWTVLEPVGSTRRSGITDGIASRRMEDGYTVEARIPWSELGITPAAGMVVGARIHANDQDQAGAGAQQEVMISNVADSALFVPDTWGTLRLSDEAVSLS